VRSTWKGSIKLSLITIPVRLFPATASSDVSFRQLHRKCHTPIQLKKWCPHCEEQVESEDLVKGYESSIDPILVERAYFLAPENKAAGSSFAVLREALGDRAGVGHVAMHGREYLVAVAPRDRALVMYTLRTAGEVRNATKIEELEYAGEKVKPEEARLARQVLEHFESQPDLSAFTDNYQKALRDMLESKGPAEVVATGEPATKSNVVDLMSALRQSLDQVSGKGRKAKISRPRRATVVKHRKVS